MERVIDLLLERMTNRGVSPQEIPRLIRDTLKIFYDGKGFSVEVVNRKLEDLGWSKQAVDERTLDLILALLQRMKNLGEARAARS